MARAILPSRMLIALLGVAVVAVLAVIGIKHGKSRPADPTITPVVLVKQPGTAKADEPTTKPAAPPLLAAVAPAGPTTAPTTRPAMADHAVASPMMATTAVVQPTRAAAPAAPTDPLSAAKAKEESDAVAARKILNDALIAGSLSGDQLTAAKQQIAALNDKIIFSASKYPNDPFAETYVVKSGDRLVKIAQKHDMTVELLKQINNITDERKLQAGKSLKIINGPFSAVVTKSTFTIDLWLGPPEGSGSMYVKSFKVALGKEDSTPLGTWMVEAGKKQKNPKFWGAGGLPPMEADDPKNPLGEYWIGLVGTDGHAVGASGYGIHGTVDPDSIGKMASMGCIRLINEEVAVVFMLLTEGKSTVIVRQ